MMQADLSKQRKSAVQALVQRIHALSLFRSLLQEPVLARLSALLDAWEEPAQNTQTIDLYCSFVSALYDVGGDFGNYLFPLVMGCNNLPARLSAAGKKIPDYIEKNMRHELATLDILCDPSNFSPALFNQNDTNQSILPVWQNTPQNFSSLYPVHLAETVTKGYGMFYHHHMFTVEKHGILCPANHPDTQRLSQLIGYEQERIRIIENTKKLLAGLPSVNVLLYGDSGTGKSSTVKAIANEFKSLGLRLIGIRKSYLKYLPLLMDQLADNPLKFIIYIDDLSFSSDDSDYMDLKAALEGNVSKKPDNVVIYATSNRRHLLHEKFSDRTTDDLHLNDTLEQQTSLASRFGLIVTFLRPDKDLYEKIVLELAAERPFSLSEESLIRKAETYAIRQGGRSPRAAHQFVDLLVSGDNCEGY